MAGVLISSALPSPAAAFTQSVGAAAGNVIPMGHEWITRMAAIEVMGFTPSIPPDVIDPDDPRRGWGPNSGGAWNPSVASPSAQAEVRRLKAEVWNDQRYASRYKAIYDAIVGERWVDLAGYNIITSRTCWDAVAQEPAAIQYDHFMRRYDDSGPGGGVHAAKTSQERFVAYFVAAAMAPKTNISAYDGGAGDSTAITVDKNYFLFGRAVHLFEDSFSPEHTVRVRDDHYIQVREVKSYLCALGSEQHSHSIPAILDYSSGDVIWNGTIDSRLNPTWGAYKASNMKLVALVAVEATKDLWAAFIRTMAVPMDQREAVARGEANTLVSHWLSYNENDMRGWYDDQRNRDDTYVLAAGQTGKGKTQTECMGVLDAKNPDQAAFQRDLEKTQRVCLYNAKPWTGFSDEADPQMNIWFSWRWLNGAVTKISEPPVEWTIPSLPADTGVRVRIKSMENQRYMMAPGGIVDESLIYNRDGSPIDFIMVGAKSRAYFRSTVNPLLFLDYREITGAVKLYAPNVLIDPASYDVSPVRGGTWTLRDLKYNQYMWLSGDEPYLTSAGTPASQKAWWRIDGLN